MNEQQRGEVAQALEVSPELLPFIPELVADLWVLGSSLDTIVELIRSLNLPPGGARILDLGCGKGAISINLAKEFGFRSLGVDLFEPFITEARKRAQELNVSNLCEFVHDDMRNVLKEEGGFDIAVYAAVGGVLGCWDECIAHIRRCVRPGGYIIIDDGFLSTDEKVERPGYEHYVRHEETLQQLTAYGDSLLHETIIPVEEIKAIDQEFIESIGKRATKLAELHSDFADALTGYLKNQELESQIIETMLTGAVWLLQRT